MRCTTNGACKGRALLGSQEADALQYKIKLTSGPLWVTQDRVWVMCLQRMRLVPVVMLHPLEELAVRCYPHTHEGPLQLHTRSTLGWHATYIFPNM